MESLILPQKISKQQIVIIYTDTIHSASLISTFRLFDMVGIATFTILPSRVDINVNKQVAIKISHILL